MVHRIVNTREDLTFDLDAFARAIDEKTKLVSIPHTTNIAGTTPALRANIMPGLARRNQDKRPKPRRVRKPAVGFLKNET